jgi:hypothetical protein
MSVERAASGIAGRDPDSGFLGGGGLVRARERETREREGERTGAPPLGPQIGGLGAEQTREWRACQGFETVVDFWFENSSGVFHQPKVNVDSK